MTQEQLKSIDICKDILLSDFAIDIFPEWTSKELKEMGIPSEEIQEYLKPSEKNEFEYHVTYDAESKLMFVHQTQLLDHAKVNHFISVQEDGTLS